MRTPGNRKGRSSLMLTIVLALVLSLLSGASPAARESGPVYALEAPPVVTRSDAAQVGLASIASEAGISAWFQAPSSITLADVRDAYRTIEAETADYIIGSVPVADYPESEDVHVYVHTDGWILAYYLAADPVGKIYDWRVYHNTGRVNISTKLENTIAVVTGEAGVSFTGATHYHFAYPNATQMMLIVEWVQAPYAETVTDSCEVNLPGSYAYYERSWSLGAQGSSSYRLDGVLIHTGDNWQTAQGTLTTAQLMPDQFHTVEIAAEWINYAYGGLALIYRVP
jgi:hypothetical protein